MRKKFFAVRVVRPWPRLPRGAVAAPSLAGLKARLDGAGSTLGWWRGSLPVAGGWNWVIYRSLPTPNHPVIYSHTPSSLQRRSFQRPCRRAG